MPHETIVLTPEMKFRQSRQNYSAPSVVRCGTPSRCPVSNRNHAILPQNATWLTKSTPVFDGGNVSLAI
ncbi:hypothetical protein [Allocoleopsis sp.]|uniref:hypothetical protein n=1 Tax=Allocoleopsis sp. TaxID=3088169 RepID=UPI002FD77025